MNVIAGIGRLLALLAITGLAMLPIGKPLMMPAAAHSAMDHHHHATTGMAEDHNCCPKKTPTSHCDVDCLAICAAQTICNVAPTVALALSFGAAMALVPHSDVGTAGLKQRPPPKPPKL
jgi:hypothetical protein